MSEEVRFEPKYPEEAQGIVERSHLAAIALNEYIADYNERKAEDKETSN